LCEPTFSVVLFDPHAAKRVGFKPAIFPQLGRVVDDSDGTTECTLAVTRSDLVTVEASWSFRERVLFTRKDPCVCAGS
jgi:hypothetical protein